MSRILLADDSPHAQRMGERILREEGYEVVTVTDGNTALVRLADVDPDVVFADVSLPSHSGYEICKRIKSTPRHEHVRVILTAGLLEPFDDDQAKDAGCDGILKKPFESSVVLDTVKPLIAAAVKDRQNAKPAGDPPPAAPPKEDPPPAEPPKSEPPPPEAARPITMPQVAAQAMRVTPVNEPVRIGTRTPPSMMPERRSAELATRIEQVFEALPRAVPVRILAEPTPPEAAPPTNGTVAPDVERVRAAVTVALDAALPGIIDKITEQVLIALSH
jgi:CheY-like chemotaxis protein